MEFSKSTDSLRKKSRRVRSWYLYEQFKSLESSQLDAAQRLKDKSYQERILRQELSERRARRRLCDQFGLCQSESRIDRSLSNSPSKTILSSSTDNLFESFSKLHGDDDIGDTCSCDGSQSSKFYEECKTGQVLDDLSKENSIASVVCNIKYEDNLTDNIKEDLQSVQRDIAESINLQLETVKENIECIEAYTKLCDEGKISDDESFNSIECACKIEPEDFNKFQAKRKDNDCNVLQVWSKLVTFSYNLMQMSSGNCYNDYSTQLLTAVLLCDVLRRGLNKMCYIFQPYVSPIRFAPSEADITTNINKKAKSVDGCENCTRQKVHESSVRFLPYRKPVCTEKRYTKKDFLQKRYTFDNKRNENKLRRMNEPRSEPLKSVVKLMDSNKTTVKSSSSLWPEDFRTNSNKSNCNCHNMKRVVNSMLQLSRCLDSALREINTNC